MHGRVKTITTADQEFKQKKIREAKVLAYKAAISVIQKKREQQQFDDEAFQATRDILLANPDISTVWNYRREIILSSKSMSSDFQLLLELELPFTELCLRVNPKSYGTWHHRLWALSLMPSDMWKKEMTLCNKYLAMDERNFHCWDYRKIVAAKAEIPDSEEYNYTTQKIESNFSNYSAWHYRSKLLPRLFEDSAGIFTLEEQKHKEELELVQNAAFTDPDDQSAWFYQRWLLGLLQPKLTIVSAHITEDQSIVVALTRSIRLSTEFVLEVLVGDLSVCEKWEGTGGTSSTTHRLKLAKKVPLGEPVIINIKARSNVLDSVEIGIGKPFRRLPLFSHECGPDLAETLREQLSYCQQLLELEPDSKWTLLTSVLLMHSLDVGKYSGEIVNALNQLLAIDKLRKGYYSDLLSKVYIELALLQNPYPENVAVSNNLSCLYHTQYLVLTTRVCLSGNKLKDAHLKKLHCLLSCRHLTLDKNMIQRIDQLPVLETLEFLSLKENPIQDVESCRNFLRSFPRLSQIDF